MNSQTLERALTVALAVAGVLLLSTPAQASFPGRNGRILLVGLANNQFGQFLTMNPDGTGVTRIGPDSECKARPQFSRDGSKIVYVAPGCAAPQTDIRYMNADGSGITTVTSTGAESEDYPSWSPDGTKLAIANSVLTEGHYSVAVLSSGGGPKTVIVPDIGRNASPVEWSPTGTRIAFIRQISDVPNRCGLYTINPDGTNEQTVRELPRSQCVLDMDWSPDGTKLAFTEFDGTQNPPIYDMYVVNTDGSNLVKLTPPGVMNAFKMVWSPDSKFIAFGANDGSTYGTYLMRADGAGAAPVAPGSFGTLADWQPRLQPLTGNYPRPKGATPIRISLVPAYQRCISTNSAHGSPLAYPSCTPPMQTSEYATVGTPDANGKSASSVGVLTASVKAGDPDLPSDNSDVTFAISVTDVRQRFNEVSDYTGDMQADLSLRITDQFNEATADQPGTIRDLPLLIDFQCVSTSEPGVGATCKTETSANAVTPSMVRKGKRAIWEIGQVRLIDGGEDGMAATQFDNEVFARQGLFVP